ncbi:MAG: hypothetical protein WAL56_11800 [Candidatus Sulfotelmatobacter sp.]
MTIRRLLKSSVVFSVMLFGLARLCLAQNTSENQSWTSSSQQQDPNGAINPTRTRETHTVVDGRVVDRTLVETLGPDGRYVLYSDTEKESGRVNDTTVRNVERSFARGPDGERTLIQERQEESRSLAGGEQKVVRTVSNPDANGALQVVQRELEDSKQLSPGVRETTTTVLTPDMNGGFAPAVRIEQRETQSSDGTIDSKKSTLLSDGTGRWQLSEVREGTSKQENGPMRSKDERVFRLDGNGNLSLVERTVSKQKGIGSGEKRDTVETYSTNVPGQAGNDSLQLVQRETTVEQNAAAGGHSTTRQIERANPGDPGNGLRVAQKTIDIVKPGGSGVADEKRTILSSDSDGRLGEVWVDVGKTSNPSAIQVDTRPPAKPQ